MDLKRIINRCIDDDIELRDLRYEDALESTVEIREEDFQRLKKIAGHSHQVTVMRDGGAIPFLQKIKANILTVTGAFLLGALIFYQSLFVAEIRVDGYEKLTETEIRETLASAGLYEGVRIEEDYRYVKRALYETHEEITWVSVFADGRLIKVNIAEAGNEEEEHQAEDAPVDIIAEHSGVIERILPLQGMAMAEKGDYVNAGDVLISGAYEYQSSDYSKGDETRILYSHAKGQTLARVPRVITYYLEKEERVRKHTGRRISGLHVKIGDFKLDTTGKRCSFQVSERKETELMGVVKPLPISVAFVKIEEVTLEESPRSQAEIGKVIDACLRQYEKKELTGDEKILRKTIDYTESAGLIKADVFLEVAEDIGIEREINVRKKEKGKEKSDE